MDRKIERQKDRAAKESAPRAATPAEQATLDAIKVNQYHPLLGLLQKQRWTANA